MSHITRVNESCHVWTSYHVWMGNVVCVWLSHVMGEWVIIYVDETCHTFEWAMSRVKVSHLWRLDQKYGKTLQHAATCCIALHHTATSCHTLQHRRQLKLLSAKMKLCRQNENLVRTHACILRTRTQTCMYTNTHTCMYIDAIVCTNWYVCIDIFIYTLTYMYTTYQHPYRYLHIDLHFNLYICDIYIYICIYIYVYRYR